MDDAVRKALETDLVIDITTKGRKTGQPRHKEIWFHYLGEGEVYITGSPGKRGWYANMLAEPEFTFHLKRSVRADLNARATAVTDLQERQDVLDRIEAKRGRNMNAQDWVDRSPLVKVEFPEL